MTILCADFIFTCNDNFDIIEDGAVCFDKKIIDIGKTKDVLAKYQNQDVQIEKLPKNSVIMPGLINTHTHLEFSQNIATLSYGSFMSWLNSVIANRDELSNQFSKKFIEKLLLNLLGHGTTTIGNISSFGIDLSTCKNAKQKVIYFVEAIGSAPDTVDALFNDFQVRFHEALKEKSEKFIPAVSIHSPYSTHKIMAKKVIELSEKEDVLVSAHFMESLAEKEWVEYSSGEFKIFFNNFNPNLKSTYENAMDFLKMFKNVKSLFTHAVFANEKELDYIASLNASITHCPTSNRLLGSGKLDIEKIVNKNILLSLGTDGLSSNTSLNMWDEMRNALFLHIDINIEKLAKILLLSATNNAAKALNIKCGQIQNGYCSDIISFCLKDVPKNISQLPLQVILQINKVDKIYINGEKIL